MRARSSRAGCAWRCLGRDRPVTRPDALPVFLDHAGAAMGEHFIHVAFDRLDGPGGVAVGDVIDCVVQLYEDGIVTVKTQRIDDGSIAAADAGESPWRG